jgi:hypothetical protein
MAVASEIRLYLKSSKLIVRGTAGGKTSVQLHQGFPETQSYLTEIII